ncbi:MAG TPA: hypothetical protein DCQ93_09335 [Bacteroidetes bacterium]|nr:hypothetical protein [Bacteroidota bacterium]
MDNSKLKMLLNFSYPGEAYIAKSHLEAEGIDCFITNENLLTINPLLSHAVGGVKLMVREEDYERAKEILEAPEINSDEWNSE